MYFGIQGGKIPDSDEIIFCSKAPDGLKNIKAPSPIRTQEERPIILKIIEF